MALGRTLIVAGAVLVVAGLLVNVLGGRFPGRLPGDIVIRKNNFAFYFPIATSILLSLVVTLVLWLFRRP